MNLDPRVVHVVMHFIQQSASTKRRCVVCDRKTRRRAAFIPADHEEHFWIPQMPGTTSLVVHALCRRCGKDPGARQRITRWMESRASAVTLNITLPPEDQQCPIHGGHHG